MIDALKLTRIVITIAFVFIAIISFACTCDQNKTLSTNVIEAEVVFGGHVISRTLATNHTTLGSDFNFDTTKLSFPFYDFPVYKVEIKVDRKYRGKPVTDTVIIITEPNSSRCGYYFEVGRKYIVYGYASSNAFRNAAFMTNHCTRTQVWNLEEEKAIMKITG